MTIVLYDTEHFETVETQVRLLNTGGHRIIVLAPEAVQVQLVAAGVIPGAHIHFRTLPARTWEHPGAVYRTCRTEKAGLLILATVSYQHLLFARACRRLRPLKILLGVHDLHDLFAPVRKASLRGMVQYVGRKQLSSAVSGYVVLLDELKTLLRKKFGVRKPVHVIPGSFYRPAPPADLDAPLRIVVPGSIDPTRRNYNDVRQLARALHREVPATITVVGGNPDGWRPSWFNDYEGTLQVHSGTFVEAEVYERELARAEIVLAPLPEVFRRSGHPDERYGESKSSGSFFDAVRHGKPLLLPAGVPVPELLAPMTLSYIDHEHLYYLVLALLQNPAARARLRDVAAAHAAAQTPEGVRARLLPALTGSS
ncbi:hypothetical protein [Flaviaesturariibacter amylovorans]|uniref:Glycosyltransferase n=1 Tax=Flaviaesturariibacter amylovorans TaxID=1084520 RepID=A0ABP8GS28_9BACT